MTSLVINARFLSQPMTGVQRFAAGLSLALLQSDIPVRFLTCRKVLHAELAEKLKAEIIGNSTGILWEQRTLPRYLNAHGKPFLLNLANMAPLMYKNQALVIHDLAFLRNSKWFSPAFSFWYRNSIPFLAKRAKVIFTVSEFSKNELMSFFPETEDKLEVVGNGLGSFPSSSEAPSIVSGKPYVLAFGGNNERKNVEVVMKAMNMLESKELQLIIIGRESDHFSGRSNIGAALKGKVHYISDPSDQDLADLYSNAAMLVYPSLYEGFGLPPLEALSFGCPSVLSDISVFQEIYHGAALFADPHSPKDIARSVDRLFVDEELRQAFLAKRQELLEKHTFNQVAQKILAKAKTVNH